MATPATLPADFFEKLGSPAQTPVSKGATPDSLPADFFDESGRPRYKTTSVDLKQYVHGGADKLPPVPGPKATMTELPPRSFGERALEVGRGMKRAAEEIAPALILPGAGPGGITGPTKSISEVQDIPLIPLSEAFPEKGALRGVSRGLEGLSSPLNASLMLSLPGVGSLIRSAPSLTVQVGYDLFDLGLSAYFGARMADGTFESVKGAYDKWKAKDYAGMREDLGSGTVDAIMIGLTGKHMKKGVQDILTSYSVRRTPGTPGETRTPAGTGSQIPPVPPPPGPQGPIVTEPPGPPAPGTQPQVAGPPRPGAPPPGVPPVPGSQPPPTSQANATAQARVEAWQKQATEFMDALPEHPTAAQLAEAQRLAKQGMARIKIAGTATPEAQGILDRLTVLQPTVVQPEEKKPTVPPLLPPVPTAAPQPPTAAPPEKPDTITYGSGLAQDRPVVHERVPEVKEPETPPSTTPVEEPPKADDDEGGPPPGEPIDKLPKELAGAKPRYSYGANQFELEFESDVDRAAYISAQTNPSKRDADYVKFAMDATGETEEAIRERGRKIKESIKQQAAAAPKGTTVLSVPESTQVGKTPTTPVDKPTTPLAAPGTPEAPPLLLPPPPLVAPPEPSTPAETPEEVSIKGHQQLTDMIYDKLTAGETIGDNRALTELADVAFGGTRANGAYTSRDSYDAMEAAVNRWVIEHGSRLLAMEPQHAVEELRTLLQRLPTQADRTQEQIDLQQFSTPPTLAYAATRALSPKPGEIVLEPSAGTGGLASWAKAAGAEVQTNEIAPRRLDMLRSLGFEPTAVDAEKLHDFLTAQYPDMPRPTAILMNPPFSATGGRVEAHKTKYGLMHVDQALQRLAEGGRLVAIMGRGVAMDRPSVRDWWEKIAGQYTVRANVSMPGKEYMKYGTTFDNQMLVIDKTGPTQGDTWKDKLANIESRDAKTLEDVLDAIRNIPERAAVAPRPGSGVVQEPVAPSVLGIRPSAPGSTGSAGGGRSGVRSGSGGDSSPVGAPGPVPGAGGIQPSQPPGGPVQPPQPGPVQGGGGVPPDVLGGPGGGGPPAVSGGEPPAGPELGASQGALERTEESGGTFSTYSPQKLTWGVKHPGKIVEASSMAAIEPPDITYKAVLPATTTSELSDVQLESVLYAGQRHEQRLPDGSRAAFFNGDGTGVGKGRQMAAIITDNFNQGRKKALWVSERKELLNDAIRDFTLINQPEHAKNIKLLNKWKDTDAIDHTGTIFSTYTSLAMPERLKQIQDWKPDIIIFDEAHAAKNAEPDAMSKPSAQGQAVMAMQKDPENRIVYASATGATEPRNMAYMDRLGLWGPGTSFPGGFKPFLDEIQGGGVGTLEMVAQNMKALGMYVSRTLSYEGVEYEEVIHKLSAEQRRMYDAAAEVWLAAANDIVKAVATTNSPRSVQTFAKSQFWSANQRFNLAILTAFKIPTVILEMDRVLALDHSVILDFDKTGEAQAKRTMAKATEEGADIDDLDFSPKESIENFIKNIFPTVVWEDVTDDRGNVTQQIVLNPDGKPLESQEALDARQALLDKLDVIKLPDNPLDQIINYFGSDKVAEISGRTKRLILDKATGKREYVKVAPEKVAMSKTALRAAEDFNSGRVRIVIISPKGGTGISLDADRKFKNQQIREHFVVQLSWNADKQQQKFGRGHRANQVQPPIFTLFSTDAGPEKRFSSTIARRLESMGALTKGQRDATGGGLLAKYNFEGVYGEAALNLLYDAIENHQAIPGIDDPEQFVKDMGLLTAGGSVDRVKIVERFLNRIGVLNLDRANAFFAAFLDTFERVVRYAKQNGTYDEGVTDLKGLQIRLAGPGKVVHTDQVTGAKTKHYQLDVDEATKPISWSDMESRAKELANDQLKYISFYRQKRSGNFIAARFASTITDPNTGSATNTYRVYKPTGEDDDLMHYQELSEKYEKVPREAAAEWWTEKFEAAPKIKTRQNHVIAGATLPIWRQLKAGNGRRLRVVRANITGTGERIVGVLLPPRSVGEVLAQLGVERNIRAPEDVFNAVLNEGERFNLMDKMTLRRATFKGDTAIMLDGADVFKYKELRTLGLLNERPSNREIFMIPTEERRGVEVLTRLLKAYPVVDNAPTSSEAGFINLDLLMPKSLQAYLDEKLVPTLEAFGVTLAGALRGIKEILVPRHGVPEPSLNAMMKLKGTRDYAEAVLSESLSSIQQAFAKMPQADQIAFMDRYKRGIAQPTADMTMLADWWRGVDANLHRIASVWRPSLAWKDNHFRIFWKIIPGRPTSRGGFMGLGRKPIQGTKGFFRHATLADVSTGIARGGIPHTYNPIDMMMMAHADVMKFVTAQKMWDQAKQMRARKFVRFGEQPPAGFAQISDRIADVYFRVPQGMVEAGHWYVEENLARIIENYLSHDWLRSRFVPRGTTGIMRSVGPVAGGLGRSVLWAKNFTTSIELGLSPFHLVFETFEAAGSQLGMGTLEMWNEGILKGDPQAFMRGMADALQAPIAPYTMAARGGQAIRAVRATGGIDLTRTTGEFKATERQLRHHIEGLDFARNNPVVMQNLRELFDGGLKLEMNPIYRNSSLKAFQEAISNPNPANRYIGAVIHMLPAFNQMLMKPLFQVYIPRLKVGAALQEYAQQIRENADELAAGTISKERIARQVVDSVENRFGEMNWDNLWWDHTLKSSMQVAFRSTTWRVGNMKQFAGAIGGQANEFLEPIQAAFKGLPPPPGRARFMARVPKLDPHMGWFLGIVITTAVINTLIQTLFTGEPPKDLADLMNPRTGGLDDRGKPNRVVSPTYLKDLAMFRRGPGRYIASGLSSIVQRLPEIWRNRDFYGNYVYDPEEPTYKQLKDMVVHVVGMPFTVSNIFKAKEQGGSLSQEVMGAVGFPRASREIDLTAAENYALGKLRDKGGMPPKTPAQQETSTAVRTLAKQLRAEQPGIEDHIRQMLRDGTLSEADEQKARKRAEGGYLEGLVKNMGIVDFLNVYELATPAEKNRLKQTLSDKELLIDKLADPQRELIRKRYLKALGFPDISHRGVLPPLPGGVNSTMTASAFRPPSSAA